MVNIEQTCFEFYDPMGSEKKNLKALKKVAKIIYCECSLEQLRSLITFGYPTNCYHRTFLCQRGGVDYSKWEVKYPAHPIQQDAKSCGVFILKVIS